MLNKRFLQFNSVDGKIAHAENDSLIQRKFLLIRRNLF